MNSQIFKFAGLNSAILAVLMLVASPFELHAQPPSEPNGGLTKERVLECNTSNAMNPAALALVGDFWQQAWGRELAVGSEGMALQETAASGVWEILVGTKGTGRYSDRGTFIEEARYAVDLGTELLDRAYKQSAKASHIQRYVMAGTVVGTTGVSIAVTAMVTELGTEKASVARIFSILQIGTDAGDAAAFAEDAANRLDFGGNVSLASQEPSFEKSGTGPCWTRCATRRTNQRAQCDLNKVACLGVVAAGVATCVIGCVAFTGPALAICLGACDLLLTSGTAGCLAAFVSCTNTAENEYSGCVGRCAPCAIGCGVGNTDH